MTVDLVIQELRKSRGMLAPAALQLGCARSSLLRFLANHSRAAAAYKNITQSTTDHVETKMIDRPLDGDGQMIKLYLGAKAADRGYANGPTAETNGESASPISSVIIRAIPRSYFMMKFAGEDQLLNRAQTQMVLAGETNASIILDAGPSEPPILARESRACRRARAAPGSRLGPAGRLALAPSRPTCLIRRRLAGLVIGFPRFPPGWFCRSAWALPNR